MDIAVLQDAPRSRDVGRRYLLSTVEQLGSATRLELAEATGMSLSTVSTLAKRLVADGVLSETPVPAAGVGRPSRTLTIAPVPGPVLGIDLGHSHLTVAVGNTSGHITAQETQTTDPGESSGRTLRRIAAIAATLLEPSGAAPSDLRAVAIGVPAPVDRHTGRIASNNILPGWVDFAPAQELTELLGVPVVLENDANLGALGERAAGAAVGIDDFLFVKVSSGIGAGLFLNGRIYHGGQGSAGEIGHLQVRPDGHLCRCGSRGCLETVVSLPHIIESLQPAYDQQVTLDYIRQLLADDDAGTARVLTDLGATIGHQLAGLCTALNPSAIVVGGTIGTLSPHVAQGITSAVGRSTQPFAARQLTVVPSQLGDQAEIVGAIGLAATAARRATA
jgi:predicted NBD/HSP70 family sugar kinase